MLIPSIYTVAKYSKPIEIRKKYDGHRCTHVSNLPNKQVHRMNSHKQVVWVNRLNVDDIVPWEVGSLCNLMNAIFSEAVDYQVQKLRKEKYCGCGTVEAIAPVIELGILWKQFTEAIRIMKLDYHKHVTQQFQN